MYDYTIDLILHVKFIRCCNETFFSKAVAAAKKETPVAVRTRRYFMQEVHLSSPSDAQLSPCTTKLFGKGGKKVSENHFMIFFVSRKEWKKMSYP
uniref:Uncharacterized protein n=1 Tax=Angiostrongylus cantonensis TaxID=6313 RepID=A0A0K0CVK5_ANGCA